MRGEISESWRQISLRRDLEIFASNPHCPTIRLLERCWELRAQPQQSMTPPTWPLPKCMGATLLTSDQRLARSPGIRCDVELLA